MRVKLEIATRDDAVEIAYFRNLVSGHLKLQYGLRPLNTSDKGVLFDMKTGTLWVAKDKHKIIASLKLATRKPWAIDVKYFSVSRQPLYLTSMAVHPDMQRKGVGRLCLDEVIKIAKKWPADAIRLDAHDARHGAGEFYRKCGYREAGRASYRNTPLIYFEMLT